MLTEKDQLEVVYVEYMPTDLVEGKLYVSETFQIAIHLCACGCKGKTITPLTKGEWTLIKNPDNTITLDPSIGNWLGKTPYHAHYFIKHNKIEWC